MLSLITTVFFDLDGTLLPMDMDEFTNGYFKLLVAKAALLGYDPEDLIKTIWAGIKEMVMNDGTKTNEEAFWQYFAKVYGEDKLKDKEMFDSFYANEFRTAKQFCGYNPDAPAIVKYLKEKGKKVVLATNPIFPETATKHRMEWAGLCESDFEFVTVYENCSSAKPNLKYYEDVLERAGVKPEEVLMVGNDTTEDLVATKLGMKVFIITDCLIDKGNVDLSEVPHGDFKALKAYIDDIM